MPNANWIEQLPRGRLICEFSAWSADLTRLADDLARVGPHVDVLHVDVADGHFAPALLYFPDLVAQLRKLVTVPIHTHLMVDDAILLQQIEQFAEAGSDLISVHLENASVLDQALDLLDRLRIPAGLALKIEARLEDVRPCLPRIRFLTLLGTAIGVKGVGLDDGALGRLAAAKRLIARSSVAHRIVLASDGGNRENTVPLKWQAGADTVVLGSLAFNAPDLAARMAWLHGLRR